MRCQCGDPVSGQVGFEVPWTAIQREAMAEHRKTRCESCARELVIGTIPRISSTMHSSGGGTRVIRSGREMS